MFPFLWFPPSALSELYQRGDFSLPLLPILLFAFETAPPPFLQLWSGNEWMAENKLSSTGVKIESKKAAVFGGTFSPKVLRSQETLPWSPAAQPVILLLQIISICCFQQGSVCRSRSMKGLELGRQSSWRRWRLDTDTILQALGCWLLIRKLL